MRDELQRRYREILLKQTEEGLTILEKLSVSDETYQQVVVNINNASNIAFQLEHEITKREEELNEKSVESVDESADVETN